MKKKYTSPLSEIVLLETMDVITYSADTLEDNEIEITDQWWIAG